MRVSFFITANFLRGDGFLLKSFLENDERN